MLKTKVAVKYQNPHAESELTLALDVIENTPAEELDANIIENSKHYVNWLDAKDAHKTPAVLIGGGDSINDHIKDIQKLQGEGAIVFAMNGAATWALSNDIHVDYQVILDAKEETANLVEPGAWMHAYASQCHPETLHRADNLILWHLVRDGVEDLFPPDRVKKGGYALVGGDSSVGVCALCLVYTQGFRELHCFGYDTSYRDGKGHGYKQRINDTMPTMTTNWAGFDYTISLAMKDQVQNFLTYSQALKDAGCTFHVYGEGLLQTVYKADAANLSEKDKYRLMWMFPVYRDVSPGEHCALFYLNQFKPQGKIIDYGCGTGRASVVFAEQGREPYLIDFADNCRDEAAKDYPFLEWDLTQEIPVKSEHGFCADVMEHIPTDDVDTVIINIMSASEKVFFQISTVDDVCGDLIDATLHHTVKPHAWWKMKFHQLGYRVVYDNNVDIASLFYICT